MITHHASRSCEQRIRGKYIAFHKGALLSDYILDYIIDAGVRGLMTTAGARLLLLPDTRHGQADISGLRLIGKYRKSDCLTLKQLIRKIRQSKTLPKSSKKRTKNPYQNNALKTVKTQSGIRVSDCHFLHKERGSGGLGQAEELEVQP